MHIIVGSELLGLFSCNCALFDQITLVAYENHHDIALTMILDGFDPPSLD